jgi:hypothetical protein
MVTAWRVISKDVILSCPACANMIPAGLIIRKGVTASKTANGAAVVTAVSRWA